MRRTTMCLWVGVLALGWTAAQAPAEANMADLAPAQTVGLIEVVDAAGLRADLLASPFWKALQETEVARRCRASQRYAEHQKRLQEFLARLDMTEDQAVEAYLGGRCALVLLPSDDPKKPYGVFMTETDDAAAEKLLKAAGAVEVGRHRDVALWEVRKENQPPDRLAYAGGVLLMTRPRADELERVLDVIVGGGAALGTEGHFAKAVEGLPDGWRIRAYAAKVPPRGSPGAAALYPKGEGRVHLEWRIVSAPAPVGPNRPVALTGPRCLPETSVAAVASAFHPTALWQKAQEKMAALGKAAEAAVRKAKMFIRGWFPGQPFEAILGAFGPECAGALVKGEGGGPPGLVGMVRLTENGRPVAFAFKDGLAAKAMILGTLGRKKDDQAPRLTVREEEYGGASMVVIEAPGALKKVLGEWADEVGLTVAVGKEWLIVGTTPAAVKRTIDTAAGRAPSLAHAMAEAGETVPEAPVTRWGVLRPALGADVVLDWTEKLLGRQRIEAAKKATDFAELLTLVKRFVWQRTDEPEVIHGCADLQVVD